MPPIPISTFIAPGNKGREESAEKVQPGLLGNKWLLWLALSAAAFFIWRKVKK